MSELKMGKKDAPKAAAKRFDKLKNQSISQRISDFLKEEGKKENAKKKIARLNGGKDLEI